MIRKRWLLLVLAALAVPIPAFGLVGGSSGAQAEALSVSVSLDSCGVASSSVICKLDTSFNEITGAQHYTASVAGPDGSVVDYGDVSSGGSSLWVPYVGNGTYTVTVSAWGNPPSGDKTQKPLATDSAGSGGPKGTTTSPGVGKSSKSGTPTASASNAGASPGVGSSSSSSSGSTSDTTGTDQPPTDCVPQPVPPPSPTPAPPPPPPPTNGSGASGDPGTSSGDSGSGSTLPGVDAQTQQTLSTTGQLPTNYVDASCPDPQQTPDGGVCCPTPAGG